MDYNEFANVLLEVVAQELSEDIKVSLSSVNKNNGVVLTGMTFCQDGINASPTIYLEHCYEAFQNGENIDTIALDLIKCFMHNKLDESIDVEFFSDYEKVSDKLFCKVINKSMNEELLRTVPYEDFLDLAVVVYCRLEKFGFGHASITVKNEHLKMWNVSDKEILKLAKENTQKMMEFSITNLGKMLAEKMDLEEEDRRIICGEDLPMFVVTNNEKTNGAAAMIFPEVMESFSKFMDDDYYILPSSIHEVLLIPKGRAEGNEGYDDLICSVNETELCREEILSNHAYFYRLGVGITSA